MAHPEHTPPIARWCQEKGYQHIVQPLQQKPDYSRHYMKEVPVPVPAPRGRFACIYLETPRMRYYMLDGVEMPCCFIKDSGAFEGMDAMFQHQRSGTWPAVCRGCRYARDT